MFIKSQWKCPSFVRCLRDYQVSVRESFVCTCLRDYGLLTQANERAVIEAILLVFVDVFFMHTCLRGNVLGGGVGGGGGGGGGGLLSTSWLLKLRGKEALQSYAVLQLSRQSHRSKSFTWSISNGNCSAGRMLIKEDWQEILQTAQGLKMTSHPQALHV